MKIKYIILAALFISVTIHANAQIAGKWSLEKANSWQKEHPWITGANFIPSSSNQSAGNVAGIQF
jgi:hypothetical protein